MFCSSCCMYCCTCGTRRKLAAFLCVWIWNETNTTRGHYFLVWVRMRREHSKSYNKQFVQTAVHLNSYSTLCLWLLHCCVAIQSHPRGLHPDPPDRKYTQLWDIMYRTFELYTYTYAREFEPGWSAPFLLWDLPSFCQFCRLALSGFYTRLSGFLVVILKQNNT